MRTNNLLRVAIAIVSLLPACQGGPSSDGGSGQETVGDGDGDGNTGPCAATGQACPNYAASAEDLTCDLDNTTSIDLVQDSRLEFGEGPDDAVRFTAPTAGDYAIWLESEPSTNGGCGVSAFNADQMLHTVALCPATGATVDLDGYYTGGMDSPITLNAGQEIVLFIGCTSWSDAQSGQYQLRIQKV